MSRECDTEAVTKFTSPHDSELRREAKELDWAVGAPVETTEFSEDELRQLDGTTCRIKDPSHEEGQWDSVVRMVENRSDATGVRNFRIDLSLLRKVLYEHRRYATAEGFSEAEMDVLRAVEFHDEKRVGVDEIMEHPHATEYAESTVYKSLRRLGEKGLVEKVRPGVYRYDGP